MRDYIMAQKERRPVINTTISPALMECLRELATKNGTSKYGRFVEEALRDLFDKHGIDYKSKENK